MPTVIERSTTVAAPIDVVAATLADFADLHTWSGAVDHTSALTDPPGGPDAARRVQIGRRTVIERVVDWNLPATVAYRIEGLPKPVGDVVNRWTLIGAGGHTDVTLTSTIDAGPKPVARLIERVVGRQLGATSDRLLADLASHLADRPDRRATTPRSIR